MSSRIGIWANAPDLVALSQSPAHLSQVDMALVNHPTAILPWDWPEQELFSMRLFRKGEYDFVSLEGAP